MSTQEFTVTEAHHKTRLDVFLTRTVEGDLSRTFIKQLIEKNLVALNGESVSVHHKVRAGDIVTLTIPEAEEEGPLQAENIPLHILYEDQYLLALDKPAGMLVHPVRGKNTGTLVNALLHHCPQLSDANTAERAGIVHRLDRETSGVILAAKDNQTHIRLSRMFKKHRVQKKYTALVAGKVEFDEGKVEAPLGRDKKEFDKRWVSDAPDAREAVTFYKVLGRDRGHCRVALFPKTGRTHQLRVHMAWMGHPILGDTRYGGPNFKRLALHAQSIAFEHPIKKFYLEISVPSPF